MRLATVFVAALTASASAAAQTPDCAEPNVLVLFDVSGSMGRHTTAGSKYNQAKAALHAVTQQTQSDVRYGLMLFPTPGGSNPVSCGPQDVTLTIPLALDNWQAIYNKISPTLYNSATASPTFFGGPRSDYDTPLYQALASAGDVADLSSFDRRNYALLITDGVQDCNTATDYDSEADHNPGVAWGQPGYFVQEEYDENRDDLIYQVDTLWMSGINTFVVGFGSGVDATTLNELARWGGTADWECTEDCYIQADNQAELTSALQSIVQIVTAETCDGIDNNCDGNTDEGTDVLCESACGSGFEVCSDGQLAECNATLPTVETCDGVDNDCNGDTDEGCDCENGDTKPCGTDTGDCSTGTQTCVNGAWGDCQGAVTASPEVCEGEHDEDCDTFTDEGCGCINGETERCGTSVGNCEPGTRTCVEGQWSACEDEIPPAADDACDGADNDCDGTIDEFCGCIGGQTRACGSSNGTCETGHQSCVGGVWSDCEESVGPATETCDNQDNDCDTLVDNDASCGSTLDCRCGSCVGPCSTGDSCPSGAECVDGFCVSDTCPPGQYCDGHICQDGDGSGGDGNGDGDGNTIDPNGNGGEDKKNVNGVKGGCDCSSTSSSGAALYFGFAGLLLLRRRRR